jgi:hypothetical protein
LGIFTAKKHPQGVISFSGNHSFLFAALRLDESGFAVCTGYFPPPSRRRFAAALFPLYRPVKDKP